MRPKLRRRALFAMAAGETLAVAGRPGKPSAQSIDPPASGPALAGIETLKPTDPPVSLPPATLVDAEGRPHGIGDFAGSGLVLNLWATWCVPCVAELPALAALAARVKDASILVLPLASDRGGAPVVAGFYRRHGIEGLPVWLDPTGAAARAWGARGIPTTLLVDRQGRERGRLEGPVDWASDAALAAVRRLVG
jgi:thiol-disulfide isomerase/thioredoxin